MTSTSDNPYHVLWQVPNPCQWGTVTVTPPEVLTLCRDAVHTLKTPACGSLTHLQIAEILDWAPDISRVSKLSNGRLAMDHPLAVHILTRLQGRILNCVGSTLL